MLAEEKASFWERICELGFIIYVCEDFKTIVSKYATPLDDSDFEESFSSKIEAIEKVKELIGWKWREKIEEELKTEQKEIFRIKASMTYKVPAGLNYTDLGIIEHFDQDEIVKEAEKRAKLYFSKNYPTLDKDNIRNQITYSPI